MNEIMMIPIDQLRHHPENPRHDLGDLTELTNSIKANGILQNLTVVFADPDQLSPEDQKSGYHLMWVVIGNRRFEASKAVGLTELPCVISEMDHKTQVATMLEENMQRQDLTVYEQAEGFQMMMDLGFTQKEISEKTGFSEKTVRERVKLTKLNKKNFAKAVNKGATLLDLIEVTKLDSKTDQNKVLEYAGTENFRKEMMDALQEQEFKKNNARLEPVVKEFMERIPENERYDSKWERSWSDDFKLTGSEEDLRKHIKKVMNRYPDVPWRYEVWKYQGGNIEFFHGKPKKESTPLSEGELSERRKAIRRGKHLRYVKSFWAKAYELRKDFVKNYTVANGQSTSTIVKIMIRYALNRKPEWNGKIQENHTWDDAYLRDVLSLPAEPVEKPDQEGKRHQWDKDFFTIWEQVDGKKEIPLVRVMLAWAVAGGVFWPDAPDRGLYKYDSGDYEFTSNRDNDMTRLYKFLEEIGYSMSDMEKQLLDGTHECYQEDAGV